MVSKVFFKSFQQFTRKHARWENKHRKLSRGDACLVMWAKDKCL